MDIDKIPCFLCGGKVEVKKTIKGKSYFICDSCGLQVFVRRAKGEERLREWMEGAGEVFKQKSGGLILERVAHLEEVKAKLKEVEDRKGFFPDKDTNFIETSLKAEIEVIKGEIKQGLKRKGKQGLKGV